MLCYVLHASAPSKTRQTKSSTRKQLWESKHSSHRKLWPHWQESLCLTMLDFFFPTTLLITWWPNHRILWASAHRHARTAHWAQIKSRRNSKPLLTKAHFPTLSPDRLTIKSKFKLTKLKPCREIKIKVNCTFQRLAALEHSRHRKRWQRSPKKTSFALTSLSSAPRMSTMRGTEFRYKLQDYLI